jgi:hypothetical protein
VVLKGGGSNGGRGKGEEEEVTSPLKMKENHVLPGASKKVLFSTPVPTGNKQLCQGKGSNRG